MKTTNKIAVVVVLVLVVLFGIAEFFAAPVSAPIEPSASSSGSASAPVLEAATQVVQYVASMPSSSVPVKEGSCWTNSIAAAFRGDAWRCAVGNDISDPCFQIPGAQKLLCNVNPTKPNDTSTFVLQLTKPLQKPQPVQGVEPAGSGWLIELKGGTLCTPYTGTLPFTANGEAPSYACAPGPLGKDISIFNINTSSSPWTADIGTIARAPANSTSGLPVIASSSTVPIVTIWQ